MIEVPSQTPQLTKTAILAALKAPLMRVIEQDISADVEPDRVLQVAQALRNELYWRAKQYLSLKFNQQDGSLGFSTLGGGNSLTQEDDGKQVFSYVFNITRADGKKFTAVIGQRAPHVKAVADDPESEDCNQKATEADGVFRYLHRHWKMDRRQKEVARHLWRTGPVFFYTPYVSDGNRYGWTDQPKVEVVTDANGMQTPQVVGQQKFANGDCELHLLTILDVTIPGSAKSLDECLWLLYEKDVHKSQILSMYGTLPDGTRNTKVRELVRQSAGTSSGVGSQAATNAREMLSSHSMNGGNRNGMFRLARYWLRPDLYELFDDDKVPVDDGDPVSLKEQLLEQFPDGLKVPYLGAEPLMEFIENERLDELWAVAKTGSDERIIADPVCADLIPIQNIINNFSNMATETVARAIPKTLVDAQLIDRKSLEDNSAVVAEVILTKTQPGQNMSNMMANLPVAKFSDQLMPLMNAFRESSREIDGVMPAMFGGGANSNTWREAEMRRNQALAQLAPDYDEILAGWESAVMNGTRQLARFGSGNLIIPGDDGTTSDTLDLAALDSRGYHAEANEGIPLTFAEETQRLQYLLNENQPIVAEKLEIWDDENIEWTYHHLGLRGLKNTRVEKLARWREILKELLQGAPVQGINPQTGGPQEQPTIQPDSFVDDPQFMASAAQRWLNTKAGMKAQKSKPDGYKNVRAYGIAQGTLAAPPPPPPPDGQGPQADAGPPAGPPKGDAPPLIPQPVPPLMAAVPSPAAIQ